MLLLHSDPLGVLEAYYMCTLKFKYSFKPRYIIYLFFKLTTQQFTLSMAPCVVNHEVLITEVVDTILLFDVLKYVSFLTYYF
jgi:hypothetical protein